MNKTQSRTSRLGSLWRHCVLVSSLSLLAACGGGGSAGKESSSPKTSETRATALSAKSENLGVAEPSPGTDMRVLSITQVSETRVSRTVFDYVLKVTVKNSGAVGYTNVTFTITGAGPGSTVLDGSVALASIAAGAEVTPADTIKIRQDRTQPFNPASLQWRIEGTPGSTAAGQLAALENSGQIPKLERGPTLTGVDLNSNGIRDDVEAYIVAQYPAAPQRAAALQTAQALQAALLVPAQDVVAAKEVSRRMANAINCVFTQFSGGSASKEPTRVVKELEGITANTKPRLLAYLAYKKSLDGTSAAIPEGGTCE